VFETQGRKKERKKHPWPALSQKKAARPVRACVAVCCSVAVHYSVTVLLSICRFVWINDAICQWLFFQNATQVQLHGGKNPIVLFPLGNEAVI